MERPYRSPIEIPALVKDYLYNKTFCELGCGDGDLLKEFAKYADVVYGIENDQLCFEKLDKLKDNPKINIIHGDILSVCPKCDVYYVWIRYKIMEKLMLCLSPKATIITHEAKNNLIISQTYFTNPIYIDFVTHEKPIIPWPEDPLTISIRPGI